MEFLIVAQTFLNKYFLRLYLFYNKLWRKQGTFMDAWHTLAIFKMAKRQK